MHDDAALMAAAAQGRFPEPRPYVVRAAEPADLPALQALEAACWAQPIAAGAAELRARLHRFPRGQCVVVWEGRVVAAVYSQRIADAAALRTATSDTVGALHTDDGAVLQLLALNALPEMRPHGLGDALLAFMLRRAALMPGVERVAAVTLCRDYARRAHGLSMEDYVAQRDARGHLVDPILRFHEAHGARVKGVLDGYRPADADNEGKGVWIEYDLGAPPAAVAGAAPRDRTRVAAVLEAAVRSRAREDRAWSPASALTDMGLDSLDLYGVRLALERELGVPLSPTLFFEHPTPQAIVDHVLGAPPPSARRVRPPSAAPAAAGEHAPSDGGREPIAIVGLGCRFPGGADSPQAYWTLLRQGGDAVTAAPAAREGLHGAGGFLDGVDVFDAPFFRIAPREAASMDPQQRLLLEVAWEALEHAGIDPASLAGTRAGIFTGVFTHDYELLQVSGGAAIDAWFGTGSSTALAAGRLAYFFGTQGPALAVNTACSSSLVAVHLAVQSLRRGESDLALAAGVNLVLAPHLSLGFSRAGMLSPSGRCRTFDAAADGYVRSDGCGVVVLKRLSEARRDGDLVLAVVRGTAVNQDGASNGLTAPSAAAQEAVIRAALADAGARPAEVSYVEAHGTGTLLGDPIEVQALGNVYGDGRAAADPLLIGSVKTNIGHAEAAAGIAGLIKVVLALQHRYVPAHLHVRQPSGLLALARIPAEITITGRPWTAQRRVAGVSSFGFSGTNAHVIVQEAAPAAAPVNDIDRPLHVLTLSATSARALRDLVGAWAAHLAGRADADLADIAFTANTGRAHFAHRLALAAASVDEARAALAAFVAGTRSPALQAAHVAEGAPPRVALLFTGQGSQYAGMARQLYDTHAGFRRTLDECAAVLARDLDRPLLDVLFGGDGAVLDETAFTQPALFAVEYALARLWMEWGVQPVALLGHSVGEYVAACLAGVFSPADGLRLVAARARLMQALPAGGAMVAVLAPAEAVHAAVHPYARSVSVAAVNGPDNVVVSGVRADVEAVVASLSARGVRAMPLRVSHAFHSPLMDPMLGDFERVLSTVGFKPPRIDVISNLTGQSAGADIATAGYWLAHAREPVQFMQGMRTLAERSVTMFLEVGPTPTLIAMGRRCLPGYDARWLASVQPGGDWRQMADSLCALYAAGVAVDWAAFDREYARRRCHLPTYPFQRQRHWWTPAGRPPQSTMAPATSRILEALMQDRGRLVSALARVEALTDDEVGRLHDDVKARP